jgi:hypothetical protein
MGILACSFQPADPAPVDPGPVDPRADWPWDSGWISVPIPGGTDSLYALDFIADKSRLLLLCWRQTPSSINNGKLDYRQELSQTMDGVRWEPLPLPSKALMYVGGRIGDRVYFGSLDSGIISADLEFRKRTVHPLLEIQPGGRFTSTNTFVHKIQDEKMVAAVTSRSNLDTSYLGWVTDSGVTPIPIQFDKRVLSISSILQTTRGKFLVGTIYQLYFGDFQQMQALGAIRSAHYGTPLEWVGSMVEHGDRIWLSYGNADIIRRDAATLEFTDSITRYRHIDTFNLDPYGAARGDMGGLFVHDSLLFLCGMGWGARDFNGVWVWNEKRQWFQHTPMIRRGIRYRNSNFDITGGLAVWRDTLYAVASNRLIKRALADIRRDLERDTLPWSP